MEYLKIYVRRIADFCQVKGNREKIKFDCENLEEFYKVVKKGDVVEFPRSIVMSHFALFIGEYENIKHATIQLTQSADTGVLIINAFTPILSCSSSAASPNENLGLINIDDVENLLGNCKYIYINNTMEKKWKSVETEVIIKNAVERFEQFKNNGANYNPLTNNCEHFVNELKYDKHECPQTVYGALIGIGAVVSPIIILIIIPLLL